MLKNIPVGYLALILCAITLAVQIVVEKTYARFDRRQKEKQLAIKTKGRT